MNWQVWGINPAKVRDLYADLNMLLGAGRADDREAGRREGDRVSGKGFFAI